MSLRALLDSADAGPWWFDGRDIFHKQPGTNLDQIIIPIPDKHEVWHDSQAVTPETARLAALAPEMAQLLLDMEIYVECGVLEYQEGKSCIELGDEELCTECEVLTRFAEIDKRAVA